MELLPPGRIRSAAVAEVRKECTLADAKGTPEMPCNALAQHLLGSTNNFKETGALERCSRFQTGPSA